MVPIENIATERLLLTPLAVTDAADMVGVLADPELYRFTGGEPPTGPELEERYRAQVGGSGVPHETWLNWIIRLGAEPIGFVQATVTADRSTLAWLVGTGWQRQGFAVEASRGMNHWLATNGAGPPAAWIHPAHVASHRVAERLGLVPTDERDGDGEILWA
jgi:RimJ/RimL family protein N-acetyltransferase